MVIDTNGVVATVPRSFKAFDADVRKRWGGEMPFRASKTTVPVYIPYISLPFPKYSALVDVFNMQVLRLWAGHIIDQMAKFYYLDFNDVKEERELEPIKIGHILTGAYGCVIGLVLAVIAFIVERHSKRNPYNGKVMSPKIAK